MKTPPAVLWGVGQDWKIEEAIGALMPLFVLTSLTGVGDGRRLADLPGTLGSDELAVLDGHNEKQLGDCPATASLPDDAPPAVTASLNPGRRALA